MPGLISRRGGFTLIELVIYIVVVSIGLLGILSVFNNAVRGSADPLIRKQVISVAEATLEEVLLKAYSDPSNDCTATTTPRCAPNTLTDRVNYNDVSDYGGWDQTGVRTPESSSTVVSGLENYRVRINVATTTLNGLAAKEITVRVDAGTESISLTGYRASYE